MWQIAVSTVHRKQACWLWSFIVFGFTSDVPLSRRKISNTQQRLQGVVPTLIQPVSSLMTHSCNKWTFPSSGSKWSILRWELQHSILCRPMKFNTTHLTRNTIIVPSSFLNLGFPRYKCKLGNCYCLLKVMAKDQPNDVNKGSSASLSLLRLKSHMWC